VLPIPAHKHGVGKFTINGQTADATYLQGATVSLNITGLPRPVDAVRHKQRRAANQRATLRSWLAESTILYLASLLESVSTVRDLHPSL
jgi:aspartyl-tRNA(Asn)/glutamyl-tRNA(Gln) amidotransferase subunit A